MVNVSRVNITDSDVERAIDVIQKIGETPSRNDKISLLESEFENQCLRNILYYTYNGYMTYNIRKLDEDIEYIDSDKSPSEKFMDFLDLLDSLNEREVTGNKAIKKVCEFFSQCNDAEDEIYWKVLIKDLDVGISLKTINKVFDNMIPSFGCMLATMFDRYPDNFMLLYKLDGYRCLALHHEDGTVQLLSRKGKEYGGYDDVEFDIAKLPRGYVYDGELMSKTGKFSGMQRSGMRKSNGKSATFNVFDAMPIDDFVHGGCDLNWYERRRFLVNNLKYSGLENVVLLKAFGPFNVNDDNLEGRVDKVYKHSKRSGYEGLIMVDVDAPYSCDRGYTWQKLKDFDTYDLEVLDILEGTGKNRGTAGSFVVEFRGNRVNVGSGITDYPVEDNPLKYWRDYIWENRASLIGRTIEVKAQEVTENLNGTSSLRFPVFLGFREDK